MAGLIAPGICRFTVHGNYATREIANVLDLRIDTTGSVISRLDAIEDQAAVLVSAWADHILDALANNYTATSVSWVDLDEADGTVGETSTGTGTDFPASGAITGTPMPGNVAYRVKKNITAQRGQRQGRMYLVGVPEQTTSDAEPNTVIGTDVTAINTALAAFKAAVEQDDTINDYGSNLVVLHTSSDDNPSPPPAKLITYEGVSNVNSLTLDATLATQRRRLRG